MLKDKHFLFGIETFEDSGVVKAWGDYFKVPHSAKHKHHLLQVHCNHVRSKHLEQELTFKTWTVESMQKRIVWGVEDHMGSAVDECCENLQISRIIQGKGQNLQQWDLERLAQVFTSNVGQEYIAWLWVWFDSLQLSTPLVLAIPSKRLIKSYIWIHSRRDQNWLSWPSVKTWPPMTQPIPRHCLTHWVNASHSFVIGSSNKLTATVLWNIRQVSTKGCRIFDCQLTTRLNMPICCFLVWVDRNPSKALGITDAALCGLSSNRYPSQPQQRGSPASRKSLKKTNADPYRLNERKEINLPSGILLRSYTSQQTLNAAFISGS